MWSPAIFWRWCARKRSPPRRPSRPQDVPKTASETDRKRSDAVRSIERFLADGNVSMARDALSFAIQMLGEFDEAAALRARIDDALQAQAGGPVH